MKKFSIIHIPVLSFFSQELYRDVGLHWKGVNFSYLLLLLAVCLVPTMIKVHTAFSDFINNDAPAIVEQIPEITITDGEVSIKEPQPYYIRNPKNDETLAIIDTTGTIKSLEDPNAVCLVTKTKLMWRQSKIETRTLDMSESKVKNFVLDSERITGWLHTAEKLLVIIIYPFVLLGSYLYRIIQALIYAAIGLLVRILVQSNALICGFASLGYSVRNTIYNNQYDSRPGRHLSSVFMAIIPADYTGISVFRSESELPNAPNATRRFPRPGGNRNLEGTINYVGFLTFYSFSF